MGEVDVDPLVGADGGHHLLQGGEHAEAEEVDLDDPEVGAVVLVPLDHHAARHGGGLQGDHLVEAAGGDHHAAGVLPEVAGEVVDARPQVHEMLEALLLGVEAGGGELGGERLLLAVVGVVAPVAELAGELVDLLLVVAEDLGHLAGGGAVAVGDHGRRHRRAVGAVALVDVLDHPLALVPRGKVEVDVRPLAALFGEEALEEELHLHGIDGGDRQRVADGAVGGRAASLGQDPLSEAEIDDVADDQEVAGEVELLDQVELFLDLRLGLGRERPEAGAGAVPGEVAQIGGRRLARRQRVFGEAVAEVGQGEVEPLGELTAGGQGLGEIGEQAGHLGRALEVALAVGGEEAAGGVEGGVVADGGQHVVQRLVLSLSVAHAVGGEEGEAELAGEADQGLVAMLLLAPAVALELDVEPAAEEMGEALEHPAGGIEPPLGQLAGERALLAAGQQVEPGRVLGQEIPGNARISLGPSAGGGRDQLAEVAIAGAVRGEEGEPRLGVHGTAGERIVRHQAEGTEASSGLPEAGLVLQHHLGAHQGLDSRLLRRLEEARRRVDAVGVHQGHGRQLQRRRPVHQILGERGAVEEREGGGGVELGVGWGRGLPGHTEGYGINRA